MRNKLKMNKNGWTLTWQANWGVIQKKDKNHVSS